MVTPNVHMKSICIKENSLAKFENWIRKQKKKR